jgi:hypothetical protein
MNFAADDNKQPNETNELPHLDLSYTSFIGTASACGKTTKIPMKTEFQCVYINQFCTLEEQRIPIIPPFLTSAERPLILMLPPI